jgi:ketosteroid isomerase-like protein
MISPDQSQAVERIILGIEQEVFTAIRQKDVNALSRFLANDFIHRTPDGSEAGKEAFLRSIAAMPVEVSSIRGEHQKVCVYGEVAVLTGVQRAEWRQEDTAEGVSSVAFTDVFALREGAWLMVLAYGVELQS